MDRTKKKTRGRQKHRQKEVHSLFVTEQPFTVSAQLRVEELMVSVRQQENRQTRDHCQLKLCKDGKEPCLRQQERRSPGAH